MRRVLVMLMILSLVTLASCGGPSAGDAAVCDAYQELVDSWPADSDAVHAAGSAEEIYAAISQAGEALAEASQSADTPELEAAGKTVGEAVSLFIEHNTDLIEAGFVPFFDESLIIGEELSGLCEEIGRPISLP